MTFDEALARLNIEDYKDRILRSNSHGELFHCRDYIIIAQTEADLRWFRLWFEHIVKWAEKTWSRPESIFQHIPQCLHLTAVAIKKQEKQSSIINNHSSLINRK